MTLHFDFTAEQGMLATSTRRLFDDLPKPLENGSDLRTVDLGSRLAEHGVLGLMMSESGGGLGLGLTEALAISFEAGRTQLGFPVIESVVAADLLHRLRPEAAAALIVGTEIATCASAGHVESRPSANGRRLLKGRITAPFADTACWLALPVRRTDRNEPGPWATILELGSPGISISEAPHLDLTYPLFHVDLEVEVGTAMLVEHELASMLAVLAAGELAGAAEHFLDTSLRYLKERVQFGKAIGTNQTLRHRVADDWVRVQGMRAAAEYAAAAFDAARLSSGESGLAPADIRRTAHVAKAYCSTAARAVAEHAMQNHGGIGFTWEFGLHVPLRRILRLAAAHGTTTQHHDALAAELLQQDNTAPG